MEQTITWWQNIALILGALGGFSVYISPKSSGASKRLAQAIYAAAISRSTPNSISVLTALSKRGQ